MGHLKHVWVAWVEHLMTRCLIQTLIGGVFEHKNSDDLQILQDCLDKIVKVDDAAKIISDAAESLFIFV